MLLKLKEIARELGVKPSQIQRWMALGLPYLRSEGKRAHCYFNRTHVERWLYDNIQRGAPVPASEDQNSNN